MGVSLILWGSALRGARRGQAARRASAVGEAPAKFDVAAQPGALSPVGEPGVSYWDPCNLARGISESRFRQYRQAEVKHGRVCMLAVVGLIAQHTWRFDFPEPYNIANFSLVPSGFAALGSNEVGGILGAIVILAGLAEYRSSDDGRAPGDFGDPLNLAGLYGLYFDGGDDEKLWRNYELSHGRLAMTGLLGAAMAEYVSGLDALDQWGQAGDAWNSTLAAWGSWPGAPP